MGVAPILQVLLFAAIARCKGDPNGYRGQNGKVSTQFGELLKPPPPPQLTSIMPVPFHAPTRTQRHNPDQGYVYQPPPPPPPPPVPPSSDFKFPAPFYKQYNFNFVPPPQPFTTPASSLFQKVSGWLFPSQETSTSLGTYSSNNAAPVKKECNPCNLAPWIPVIRYDVGAKQQKNLFPTYGPPSPTAYAQNVPNYQPQPFQQQLSPGVPHKVYGPPAQSQISTFAPLGSTYGPPSPTHSLAVDSQSPPSSTYGVPSSSYGIPSSSYGVPSSSYGVPSSTYGAPSSSYGAPSSSYGAPSLSYGAPSLSYGVPSFGGSTSTFTPSQKFNNPSSGGFQPVTPNYDHSFINNNLPSQGDVEILREIEPSGDLKLPKVTQPTGFRNSYGELITNTNAFNIPYPVSATAAESTKVKTEVLPQDARNPNSTLALANPAPFTLKGGRNIHTLQPLALPNLSVSPLPPIFNARPFRPITAQPFTKNVVQGINQMQQNSNVNIQKGVPIDYTHSIDYPPTYIKSTIIDIDTTKTFNQSKAYRNIANGYEDPIRDISSQASEDHISAAKTSGDISFESTGPEYGNDLYDNMPPEFKYGSKIPPNHKTNFADLRGVKDEDVDKYRTENNLQNIDSPLLYLKPSAPHKDFGSFVFAISTPGTSQEYEMYDDIPTTISPNPSTISDWQESRNEYSEGLVPPPILPQEDTNKPNIVQIIVPYTTGQSKNAIQNHNPNYNQIQDWTEAPEEEYLGRKVPTNTESSYGNTATESYSTVMTTTESFSPQVTEPFDADKYNTRAILNDLYDVKEPPFDIIKLQHTIDDWTVQEFSKHYKPKTRTSSKYAKQIPDEYLTTISPLNYETAASNHYNYEYYDHEGSSSMRHSVTNTMNKTSEHSLKTYNHIEKTKAKHNTGKNEDDDVTKPHIYTAASSFRRSTSTPAPWGAIQTSISPLTKEKVYVVTSKPWLETSNPSEKHREWYNVEQYESKRTTADNDVSASDNLPFKSPRFSNRPSFGFSAGSGNGNEESLKSDSSYAFSKSWHQSINELEREIHNSTAPVTAVRGPHEYTTVYSTNEDNNTPNMDEIMTTTVTAETGEEQRTQ